MLILIIYMKSVLQPTQCPSAIPGPLNEPIKNSVDRCSGTYTGYLFVINRELG